jgi:hypothetical protein
MLVPGPHCYDVFQSDVTVGFYVDQVFHSACPIPRTMFPWRLETRPRLVSIDCFPLPLLGSVLLLPARGCSTGQTACGDQRHISRALWPDLIRGPPMDGVPLWKAL